MADAASRSKASAQRIVVISDFQEGAARESLNRYAWPEDVVVEPIVLETLKSPGNLALHLVAATAEPEKSDSDKAEDGIRSPRRRVRITNGRDSDTETFSLAWLAAPESKIDGFLPAGASRVMTVPPRPDVNENGVLQVSGDDHEFDNRVYVARAQPRALNLLYVGKSAKTEDVGSPLFYLRRAMHRTPSIDPSVTTATFSELEAEPEKLSAAQVVVVRTDGDTPATVGESLGKYAQDGNLVITIVSEGTTADLVRRLTGIEAFTLDEAEVGDYAMLSEIDFEHPVLAPFAQARIRDFTKIHIWKHRKLGLPAEENDRLRVLAKFDSGSPAWIEISRNKGTVVLFLSGWEPRESQLALSSKFVPLIYGLLGQAGFSALADPTHYVGDPLPLPVSETGITLTLPDDSTVEVKAGTSSFSETNQPGFYTIHSKDTLGADQERVYAINMPPDESRVETIDPVVTLGEFGIPVEVPKLTAMATAAYRSAAAGSGNGGISEHQRRRLEAAEKEQNQKLWKWLLVGVLTVLIIETWLAGRRKAAGPTAPA